MAFMDFDHIVRNEPHNYEALANLVEICVAGAFFDYPGPANIDNGARYLDLAREIKPDDWRTHAISGALAFAKDSAERQPNITRRQGRPIHMN